MPFEVAHREASVSRSIAASSLERYAIRWLGLLVVSFFGWRAYHVYRKPVWFDELVTYYVTRTYSWPEMVRAVQSAVDAQPPTYHFLQMPALLLLGDDPRALRWVTLLASSAALGAVFVWLRRTTSGAAALAGVAMLTGSKLSHYALEARPYALLFSAAAAALACRRLAWRIVWLAVAVSLHYYGVFLPLAFAFAENTWRRRAAYALAFAPLALTIPAMHSFSLLAASSLFAPTVTGLLTTLPVLAGRSRYYVAVLVAGGIVWWLRGSPRAWPIGDRISWALIALTPVIWFASHEFTGIYLVRYSIVSLLGMAGLIAWLVHRLPYRSLVSAVFSLACLGASLSTANFSDAWDARPTARLVDQTIAGSRLPVVMGDHRYLEVHYYLRPEHRSSFQRVAPRRASNASWDALAASSTGRYAGYTSVTVQQWLARRTPFFVAADNEEDWLLVACRQQGAVASPAGQSDTHRLYQVYWPGPGTGSDTGSGTGAP